MDRERLAAWSKRFFGSPIPWLAVVFLVMTFNITRAVMSDLPKPLPVLGTVPKFQLTDQHGLPFGSEQLAGRAWVANFIFTRCPTVCPAFTRKMAKIQDHARNLGSAFHLVSFSVDPEYDTPERLMAYAKENRASSHAWSFLTGPLGDIKTVVSDGLKIAMGNDSPDGNFEGIFHGSHFVLVDPQMRIRGYYDANDPGAVERLLRDAGNMLNIPQEPEPRS